MAVLEGRGVVSAGRQWGVAPAWLAGREPCRDRSGLWSAGGAGTGGGARGGGGGWGPGSLWACLCAGGGGGWAGRARGGGGGSRGGGWGGAVGAGGVASGGFRVGICTISGVGGGLLPHWLGLGSAARPGARGQYWLSWTRVGGAGGLGEGEAAIAERPLVGAGSGAGLAAVEGDRGAGHGHIAHGRLLAWVVEEEHEPRVGQGEILGAAVPRYCPLAGELRWYLVCGTGGGAAREGENWWRCGGCA